ncbi:MAG: WD40 repeat domain-containing protein, partial [Gemmataceae bacterium]
VRRWDVRTGDPLGGPMPHRDLVQAVTFAPDGASLASAGDDYTIRRWDARTGAPLGPPVRAPDKIQALAYSPGGELLATGDRRGNVRLWEATTGKQAGEARSHRMEVRAVAFGPDGGLWSGSWDFTAVRWEGPDLTAADPCPLTWLQIHAGMKLDPNGGLVWLNPEMWLSRAGKPRR